LIEKDDEFRVLQVTHRALMRLGVDARRRVVRYMVERHVTSSEPGPVATAPAPHFDDHQMRLDEASSLREARSRVLDGVQTPVGAPVLLSAGPRA
jgi:hypothetical protein